MTVSDFFVDLPDSGERYFNEHDVHYGSHGAMIDLYRRDWQGRQVHVARVELVADSEDEVMYIPGDDDDPDSHLRALELKLRERRFETILALLGTPGWKRIFVNEETDAWWIRLYSGYGTGTAVG